MQRLRHALLRADRLLEKHEDEVGEAGPLPSVCVWSLLLRRCLWPAPLGHLPGWLP